MFLSIRSFYGYVGVISSYMAHYREHLIWVLNQSPMNKSEEVPDDEYLTDEGSISEEDVDWIVQR